MAYNGNVIGKSNIEGVLPEQYSKQVIEGAIEQSITLRLMKKLPNMSAGTLKMPVLDLLPMAYFVDSSGETPGKKTPSALAWKNKTITAEEVAVIIPIPEAYLDDASFDVWGEVKPRAMEAFGTLIDSAILFGTNKPASWPDGVAVQALSVGNAVNIGTGSDLYEDIMGESGVISKLEQEGFLADGFVADLSMRARLRGIRGTNGELIFTNSMQGATPYMLDGQPIFFPRNGSFANNKIADDGTNHTYAELIAGEWKQAVYSIRQDMTFKILSEGVIQDPSTGNILYNLAQQDMVALRMVMRLGWQLPNPVNAVQTDETKRYPFAVLNLYTTA